MSITTVNSIKLKDVHMQADDITFVGAQTPEDGFKLQFDGEDFKTLFIIKGGASDTTFTFLMGDGIQAVTDLEIEVPAAKMVAITLDSGSFKHISGEHRGFVLAKAASSDISVTVIELP